MREQQHATLPAAQRDFPSFSEGLSLRGYRHRPVLRGVPHFPSFSEGLSLRAFLRAVKMNSATYFPSFSEGLSLRGTADYRQTGRQSFPFLFGGTFIEGSPLRQATGNPGAFPFLFGGTFIEGRHPREKKHPDAPADFPSFSEGLSLRACARGEA